MAEPKRTAASTNDLPAHVTTPLLTLITQRSLDEDYAAAAARRREREVEGLPAPPSRFRWGTALALMALALVATIIGVQTQRDAEVDELSRAALVDQVEERRERVSDYQSRVRSLEVANREALQTGAELSAQLERANAAVAELELTTGHSAVHGPGVLITVDNAPDADETTQLRDEDLATLVDGLWGAGAEAIAVNGQRLTAVSGIRNTGTAIHIGGVPVNAPYEVRAIGDAGTLQANLLASHQGQRWFQLVNAFGFVYEPQNVADLSLPAATLEPLTMVEEGSAAYRSGRLYGEEEE